MANFFAFIKRLLESFVFDRDCYAFLDRCEAEGLTDDQKREALMHYLQVRTGL